MQKPNQPQQPPQQPQQEPQKQNKKTKHKQDTGITCKACGRWLLQIFLWVSWIVVYIAIALVVSSGFSYISLLVGGISFVITLFLLQVCMNVFCSNTYKYLTNIKADQALTPYLTSQIYQPCQIIFTCECFHYVTEGFKDKRRKRVTTYREHGYFSYMSWRDVSGPFQFDTSGITDVNDPKVLIKLHLSSQVNVANDGSLYDYYMLKNAMIARNKDRDTDFWSDETIEIPGFQEFNLIKFGSEMPPLISKAMFWVATFLQVIEIYKVIFKSHTIIQEYKITKLLSSRANINANAHTDEYVTNLPRIVMGNNVTTRFADSTKYVIPPPPNLGRIFDPIFGNHLDVQPDCIVTNPLIGKAGYDPNIVILKPGEIPKIPVKVQGVHYAANSDGMHVSQGNANIEMQKAEDNANNKHAFYGFQEENPEKNFECKANLADVNLNIETSSK